MSGKMTIGVLYQDESGCAADEVARETAGYGCCRSEVH
jgi:hypothetical protein